MLNTLHNSRSRSESRSMISIGLLLDIGQWNVRVYISLESLTLRLSYMNLSWNSLFYSTILFKFSIDSSYVIVSKNESQYSANSISSSSLLLYCSTLILSFNMFVIADLNGGMTLPYSLQVYKFILALHWGSA